MTWPISDASLHGSLYPQIISRHNIDHVNLIKFFLSLEWISTFCSPNTTGCYEIQSYENVSLNLGYILKVNNIPARLFDRHLILPIPRECTTQSGHIRARSPPRQMARLELPSTSEPSGLLPLKLLAMISKMHKNTCIWSGSVWFINCAPNKVRFLVRKIVALIIVTWFPVDRWKSKIHSRRFGQCYCRWNKMISHKKQPRLPAEAHIF